MGQGRILLCGQAGAGKDTVADLLQARALGRPVVRMAFADALKSQVDQLLAHAQATFGWGQPVNVRNLQQRTWSANKTLRGLWQAYGTDVVRGIDQTYWVRQLEETFGRWEAVPGALIIVTDGRFPNEIAWAKRNDFLVVKVVRSDNLGIGKANGAHCSEHYLPDEREEPDWYDLICHNDGSRNELAEWVDVILWDEATRRWPELRS